MDWLLELLKFATSGFWIFIGTVIVLTVLGEVIIRAAKEFASIFKRRR